MTDVESSLVFATLTKSTVLQITLLGITSDPTSAFLATPRETCINEIHDDG